MPDHSHLLKLSRLIALLVLQLVSLTSSLQAAQPMRYLRFDGYYSSDNGRINLNEIEVIDRIGFNRARLKTVTVNSGNDGEKQRLVDGILSTRFSTDPNSPGQPSESQPHRIQIDLEAIHWINAIRIYQESDLTISFALFGSLDGVEWVPLGERDRVAGVQDVETPGPDFRNLDLRGADLSGADLVGVDFSGADLSGANLSEAELNRSNLSGVDLTGANLAGAQIRGSEWYPEQQVDLSGANLSGADLTGTYLWDANLSGANLSGANLSNSYFKRVQLNNANLAGATVDEALLTEVNLTRAITGPLIGVPEAATRTLGREIAMLSDENVRTWLIAPEVRLLGMRARFSNFFNQFDDTLLYWGISGADFRGAEWIGNISLPKTFSSLKLAGLKTTSAKIDFYRGRDYDYEAAFQSPPANWFYVSYVQRTDTHSLEGVNLLLGPEVDFSGGDLSNVSITGKNLSQANLENVNLSNATLRNTNLSGARLAGATAQGLCAYGSTAAPASLPDGWRYVAGALIGPSARLGVGLAIDFSGEDLSGLNLSGADLRGVLLAGASSGGITGTPAHLPEGWFLRQGYLVGPGADLTNADLRGADLDGINLDGASLGGARLDGASMVGARITGISGSPASLPTGTDIVAGIFFGPGIDAQELDLTDLSLDGLNLAFANFSGCNLTRTVLSGAQLNGADLSDCNLDGADLSGANLLGAVLSRSRIVGADITGAQMFAAQLDGLRSGQTVGPPASLPLGNWGFVSGFVLGPGIDLSTDTVGNGLNIQTASLDGINLSGAKLRNAAIITTTLSATDFRDADLSGAFFGACDLAGAQWDGADLSNATIIGGSIDFSVMAGADLSPLNVSQSLFPLALPPSTSAFVTGEISGFFGTTNTTYIVGPGFNVTGADLAGADLSALNYGKVIGTPATLPAGWRMADGYFIGPQAKLAGADLSDLDLSGADLSGADLAGASLDGTRFSIGSGSPANLIGVSSGGIAGTPVNLPTGWVLRGGYLIGSQANLVSADFSGVDLSDVHFGSSDLTNADFGGADLSGADLDGCMVDGADFATAELSGTRAMDLIGEPAALPPSWSIRAGLLLGPGVDLSGRYFDENNRWPVATEDEPLNLSGSNLQGIRMLTQSVFFTDLRGSNLRNADFGNSLFYNCELGGCDVEGMVASRIAVPTGFGFLSLPDGWSFRFEETIVGFFSADFGYLLGPGADIGGADFSGLDLGGLHAGPMIGKASALPADWTQVGSFLLGPGAVLGSNDLSNLDLQGTSLDGANLEACKLSGVRSGGIVGEPLLPAGYRMVSGWLMGPDVDLSGVNLTGVDLESVNLSSANLSGVSSGGVLGEPLLPAGFRLLDGLLLGPQVNLAGASMMDLDLTACDLTGANLDGVVSSGLSGSPTFSQGYGLVSGHLVGPRVDLSSAVLTGADLSGLDFTGTIVDGLQSGGLYGSPNLPSGLTLAAGYLLAPGANLSNADLKDADLTATDLRGTNLSGADLRGATLEGVRSGEIAGDPLLGAGVRLIDGVLFGPGVNLSGTDLSGLLLSGTDLSGVDFSGVRSSGLSGYPVLSQGYRLVSGYLIGPGVNLSGLDLSGFDLRDVDLSGVKSGGVIGDPQLPDGYSLMEGYILGPGVDLTEADLSALDLSGIDLAGASLSGADLRGAILSGLRSGGISGSPQLDDDYLLINGYLVGPGVDLSGAMLQRANLAGRNLNGSNLSGANLSSASLLGASLRDADLTAATLTNATLSGVDLTGAVLDRLIADSVFIASTQPAVLPDGYRTTSNRIMGPGINGRFARYLRFEAVTEIFLYEIEAHDSFGSNLVPQSQISSNVTASGLYYLTDGILREALDLIIFPRVFMTSVPEASEESPHRVDIDFGSVRWLSDVTVYPWAQRMEYSLYTSVDGVTWEAASERIASSYSQFFVIPESMETSLDLANLDLGASDLRDTNLQGVRSGNTLGNPRLPEGYILTGGYLIGPGADLEGANLTGLDLRNADLRGLRATGVTGFPMLPQGYELRGGMIVGPEVDLQGADLRGLDLRGVNLTDANLANANLSGAKLEDALCHGTDFSGALFTFTLYGTGALYDAATDFTDALLSVGSDTVPAIPLTLGAPNWQLDTDRDGLINTLDPDDDNDGLSDLDETGRYGTSPLVSEPDTDGDGILDAIETFDQDTNPLLADTDGDGLSDLYEIEVTQTNPRISDSDGDGLADGLEVNFYASNPLQVDTDGDTLEDGFEVGILTDPNLRDTDGDGLEDEVELARQRTDPLRADSDGDGIADGLDPDSDPVPAFRAWARAKGLSDAVNENTRSSRGHPLLLHFAYGVDPDRPIPAKRMPHLQGDGSGGPTFRFAVPKAAAGVTITPEFSASLGGAWSDMTAQAEWVEEDDTDTYYEVAPPSDSNTGFFRVHLAQ